MVGVSAALGVSDANLVGISESPSISYRCGR